MSKFVYLDWKAVEKHASLRPIGHAAHEDLESKANQKNRGEEDYRKLARCQGLLPRAGLDPPPVSSALPFAGLPANGAVGSE